MELLFDIGNTRCKYALSDNGNLSAINYVDSQQISAQWLTRHFSTITRCLIANVNRDDISQLIVNWCQSYHIACDVLHSEAQKFGVRCAYEKPETLGVDRWLAVLAAEKLFAKQTCVIVDAGTATTIDVISDQGQHLGGWILPGIELLSSCLINNTVKVAAKPGNINALTFANNTSDAVNQASWAATSGMLSVALELAQQYNSDSLQVVQLVLTGGNAKQLSQCYQGQYTLVNDLIFIGMQRFLAN